MGKDNEKTPKVSVTKAELMAENACLQSRVERYKDASEYFRDKYTDVSFNHMVSWTIFSVVIGLLHIYWLFE